MLEIACGIVLLYRIYTFDETSAEQVAQYFSELEYDCETKMFTVWNV